MSTNIKLLTQQKYNEAFRYTYEICVGKESFHLEENDYQLLKKAMDEGMRGFIHFENFTISIAHIQWTKKTLRISDGKAYEEWLKLSGQLEESKKIGSGET